MIPLLYSVLSWLVWALPWVLFIGWILSMADPGGSWAVTRTLNTISAPFLNLVSGTLPRIGMLDISPILIWILAFIVGQLLRMHFAAF